MLGEIAAEIAHELRGPLAVIESSAFVARAVPSRAASELEKIQRNARLSQRLIDDVLALARGEAAPDEAFPLAELLAEAREGLTDAARFVDEEGLDGLSLTAPRGLLGRLLHALYENAVLAARPEISNVTTRAEQREGLFLIEVSDDGPGVPAELRDKLFLPLVSARRGGTGLGLALAARIAAAIRGRIELAPTEVGACFRVSLPMATRCGETRSFRGSLPRPP